MSVCLITGASSFISQALAGLLERSGHEVVRASRNPGPGMTLYDPTDVESLSALMASRAVTHVVHLAAQKNRTLTTVELTRELLDTNLSNTLRLAEACTRTPGFCRMVFMGTCDEYGLVATPFHEAKREAPVSAYGLSKLAATQMLQMLHRTLGLDVVIARPSVVYGPGQSGDMFIPALLSALSSGRAFHMSSGNQQRDFLYIDDLLEGLAAMMLRPGIEGRIINLGAGRSTTLNEVVAQALTLTGASEELIVRSSEDLRQNDLADYRVDISTAAKALEWHPRIDSQAGLARTLDWLKGSSQSA